MVINKFIRKLAKEIAKMLAVKHDFGKPVALLDASCSPEQSHEFAFFRGTMPVIESVRVNGKRRVTVSFRAETMKDAEVLRDYLGDDYGGDIVCFVQIVKDE